MAKNNNRDDFPQSIKDIAAKRVCYQCSICHCPTISASEEGDDKVSSIGVASHICAAAPKGPRYDESMTNEERKSIDNCIWLCQTHSKLIDNDEKKFTVEKLKEFKRQAEETVKIAVEQGKSFLSDVQKRGLSLKKIFKPFLIAL